MKNYESFVRDNGWKYAEENKLKAAWERFYKKSIGGFLTKEEFEIEAGENYKKTSGEAYQILMNHVKRGIATQNDLYDFAHFGWCLKKPDAIIAYKLLEHDRWEINNCAEEITREKAMIKVNEEWGFEVSRIEIIGTPYYEASDYQFIRFDCACMTWLYTSGRLYRVRRTEC